VTSHVNARFRGNFARLPKRIQQQARRAYRLFKTDPNHPGLEFKKLPPHQDIWSVRVTNDYRAIGQRQGESQSHASRLSMTSAPSAEQATRPPLGGSLMACSEN